MYNVSEQEGNEGNIIESQYENHQREDRIFSGDRIQRAEPQARGQQGNGGEGLERRR